MKAGVYTYFLGRGEWWVGKSSWKRVSLRFDLGRSWASEEAEVVTLYWESNMCKGPEVMCSFLHWPYPFIQQICTKRQPCVCTMHRGYKMNSYGVPQLKLSYVLMKCFSQLSLSYAVVTNLSSLQKWRFIFHWCSMFIAYGRENRMVEPWTGSQSCAPKWQGSLSPVFYLTN